VSAHSAQAYVSRRLAADARPRRRSVPPSLSVPVSQSVNQRWRERPRRPARQRLPAHVVQDKRAARAARVRVEIRRNNAARKRNRNQFVRVALVPGATSRLQIQIQASHHRADHAGAVLSVVNALRFASTRPAAGPSGIDDASARHVSGHCAMVVSMMSIRTTLTRESRGSMLASSRQCRTALPLFAPRANGARIRSSPSGHDIERNPHRIAVRWTTTEDSWSARLMSCEPRDLSRRIVLRTKRRERDAFTSGIAVPWSD
jgi:hypothetical protein